MTTPRLLALLDWDGTLRKGYTIVPWVHHLTRAGVLAGTCNADLSDLFQRYGAGEISHDELARLTARVYAQHLRGQRRAMIKVQARRFVREDQSKLFRFSRDLLVGLRALKIRPVIISGAPIEILDAYREVLDLEEVYGLELGVLRGQFTGEVRRNPGMARVKQHIVRIIARAPRSQVRVAMGDPPSDEPLLRAAQVPIFVESSKRSADTCEVSIRPTTSAERILDIMVNAVREVDH